MSESCAASSRSHELFHTGLLTCAGSRYFRQLQEISDSVGEATQLDDVDVGLALHKIRDAQTQLEGRIVTGRARQRYVRYLFIPCPKCSLMSTAHPSV